ncbi:hypothetical protein CEJ63_27175, partial [Acinetobacter baumannii]
RSSPINDGTCRHPASPTAFAERKCHGGRTVHVDTPEGHRVVQVAAQGWQGHRESGCDLHFAVLAGQRPARRRCRQTGAY